MPREIKVDVTKCHACHAEVARRHGRLLLCVVLYVIVCMLYVVTEAAGGGGEGEARDTESKTRTPHKDVGNKIIKNQSKRHF